MVRMGGRGARAVVRVGCGARRAAAPPPPAYERGQAPCRDQGPSGSARSRGSRAPPAPCTRTACPGSSRASGSLPARAAPRGPVSPPGAGGCSRAGPRGSAPAWPPQPPARLRRRRRGRGHRLRAVEVEHLRQRVYASVCAATPSDVHLRPEDARQALLEKVLHGVPERLRLPTVEIRAVVRDRRSEAGRSSGKIRSRGLVRQPLGTACAVSHERPQLRASFAAGRADGGS